MINRVCLAIKEVEDGNDGRKMKKIVAKFDKLLEYKSVTQTNVREF